jgi:gamma-glutamyl-gamma-aminobutyrate hydrolase PuuD
MTRPPLIGISGALVEEDGDTLYKLDRRYVQAVERAGGTPVLMPLFRSAGAAREFLDLVGGVVLPGGTDIDPRRWGERKHPKAVLLHPERERSDFLAIAEALRRDLPLLGICCGCQEINVALGGSILQHLPDRPGVRRHSGGLRHPVEIAARSRLRAILGAPRVTVNSYHHQACGTLGRGLEAAALSPDGVIEAVESPRHRFVVGMQWHPERMPSDRRQRAIFRALAAEAGRPARTP